MKILIPIFLLVCFQLNAQNDATLTPGKLFHDSRPQANKPRIKSIFQIMEQGPFFGQPKGMDIQENYVYYDKDGNNGELFFSMLTFYHDQAGKLQRNTDEPPTVVVALNKPEALMNANTIFYNGGGTSSLPVMFTDTFAINYSKINGCLVGEAFDERFKKKKFILNPRRAALFRPVTQEEYLKYFIGDLKKKIMEDSLHQAEMESELKPLKNNPSLKNTLDEVEKINGSMLKYYAFMKTKKQFYEKKLAALSSAEKKAPAYRIGHNDIALPMKDGKLTEEISGHLEYEPAEENEKLLFKLPVFTFNDRFLDPVFPKGAIQLVVIEGPFIEGDVRSIDNPLKKLVEKEVFPLIAYGELASKMYQ